MAKVQNDFYFRWAQSRIQATYTADQTLDALIEFVGVDTTTGTVEIELPDSTGADVLNTKMIWILDQGNAGTNNISVVPNSLDSTTIDGLDEHVISVNDAVGVYLLLGSVWTVLNRGLFTNQTSVSTTYTALQSDDTIIGDTSGGAFTINLPTAVGIKSKRYIIKKLFGAANQLTLDPFGTETIDTVSTVNLTGSTGAFIEIESDGANWIRIG